MNLILISLGCHKNLVDSENILGILLDRKDLNLTNEIEEADIAIINTCGFIGDAKEESIEAILEVAEYKKNAKMKKIIVAGCLAQRYAQDLMEEISEIDAIIGTGEIDKIEEVFESVLKDEKVIRSESLEFLANSKTKRIITSYPHSAYVKIAEGCDKRCTYCIIPYLRGKFRSRRIEDIVEEVENLSKKGIKEINILAQETTEYGIDIYGKRNLDELLKELVKVEDIKWIRIFYTYPKSLSEEIIEVMKNEEKIANYVDIPIQHISDNILKNMGRQGNSEYLKERLYSIRKEIPNAVFRTSVIVGFPGETEDNFEELKAFMEEFKFDYAGIFKYSREEDTKAFDLENQVGEEIKEKRRVELINIQNKISEKKNRNYIEQELEVIIDGISEESEYLLEGRTMFQAPEIDGKVLINDGTGKQGDIVKVKIEQNFDYDLLGGIVDKD